MPLWSLNKIKLLLAARGVLENLNGYHESKDQAAHSHCI